jgi:hypothetical protein
MLNFGVGEFLLQVEAVKVADQQVFDSGHICDLHRTETLSHCLGRQEVLACLHRLCRALGKVAETGLVEMRPVERAVEVAACGDRCGQEGAGCVESLVDAVAVALAGDFFDEDGCQTLRAELAMNGEEVDFDSVDFALADLQRGWHT